MVSPKRTGGLTVGLAAMAMLAGCSTVKHYTDMVRPAPRCETLEFPIYFQTGSSALTEPAREMIRISADRSRACKVDHVRVLGLADADGSAARNLELSKQRADVVASALAASGFPAPTFDVVAAGADGATSARGTADPVRRRTEVIVTFSP